MRLRGWGVARVTHDARMGGSGAAVRGGGLSTPAIALHA
eukprot:CAMPEP_0177785098 /NCGR_PEP_ID=MMETSP0491_2-20121128/20102_1 /TAXON_ID=63592 /ORGANISM="Tetraselmis chuii, Strain PLY429" /LENGTH=38 /DNA_ID= /DNA_START= /DNA_END= /DNA_ORIENTATION=